MKKFAQSILAILLSFSLVASDAQAASQSIWGATDRGPVQGTYRMPVDTGASSGPGYVSAGELQTFMGPSNILVTNASLLGTAATCNTQQVFDATMTSHGNSITSATANSGSGLLSGDATKLIQVRTIPSLFSGSHNPTVVFEGTISSVSGGTGTTSGNQSSTTTTGLWMVFGADDTTGLQNAENAAADYLATLGATPGTIHTVGGAQVTYVDNSACSTTAPITTYSGIRHKGNVMLFSFDTTHSASMYQNLNGSGTVRTFNDIAFEDMQADLYGHTCNGGYSYHCKFFEVQYPIRVEFRHLHIAGSPATTLGLDFVQGSVFADNVLEDCGRLQTTTNGGGACMAWEVSGNATPAFGANQGPEDSIIANNTCINAKTYCFETETPNTTVSTGGRAIVTGNQAYTTLTSGNGFAMVGSTNDVIVGNNCYGTGAMASGACVNIFGGVITGLAPGTKTLVADNQSYGWWDGILLQDSGTKTPDDVSISNNKIFASKNIGIEVSVSGANTVKRPHILGNTVDGSGAEGIGFTNTGTPGTVEALDLTANFLTNNGVTTATDDNKSGITIGDNVTSGTMQVNTALDDGTSTQKYGYTLSTGVTAAIQEGLNNFTGNTTSARNIIGTSNGSCLTVPTTKGSTGQFLKNTGDCLTDWAAPAGSGTVTTTGSPSSGQISKFSGASSITTAVADTDYQSPLTLTTTGTSGAATFSGHTLNVPQYTGGGGSGTVTSIVMGTGLSSTQSPLTTTGTMSLAALSANQVLGALTAVAPTGLSIPSCSAASSALTWTSGTGFGCNTISGSGTVNSGTANQIAFYSGTGTAVSGDSNITDNASVIAHALPTTITGTTATSLAVGANGATNPVFAVDDSVASVVSGAVVKGAATGGTTTITATDSGSNAGIEVKSKGTGVAKLTAAGSGTATVSSTSTVNITAGSSTMAMTTNGMTYGQSSVSSGAAVKFAWGTGASDTNLTASTEAPIWTLESAQSSRQHATGALTLQRDTILYGNPDAFVGASTLTDAATLAAVRKNAGTNATITNSSAIYVGADTVTGTVTNSYGININAATGATNNYAARLNGTSVIGPMIDKGTTFTVSGCSATSPVGGSAAGRFTSGTTGTCTAVITIAGATGSTAPNGWSCWSSDETTGNLFRQTSSTTTTATLAGTTVSGDVVTLGCIGY